MPSGIFCPGMLIGASADAIAIAQPQFSVSDISNATDPGDIGGVADIEKFWSGLTVNICDFR